MAYTSLFILQDKYIFLTYVHVVKFNFSI